jgi:hypothetical protein
MRGEKVLPMPAPCDDRNSCHQSPFTPFATFSATWLPSSCAVSRPRMAMANGTTDAMVSVMTPARIHGAPATRLQPSSHAAVTRVMSGEEPVAQHQLL